MKKIILASKSPGRKEIFSLTGLKFKIVPSHYQEDLTLKIDPHGLVKHLSLGKAQSVSLKKEYQRSVIIGADTIVVSGKKVLGKPHTEKETVKMLKMLNGKVHSVITAFTIIDPSRNKSLTKSVETKVHLKKLSAGEIKKYAGTRESLDKAGGYKAQGLGAIFIKKIEGDYFNVIGLPLFSLVDELKKFKINPL